MVPPGAGFVLAQAVGRGTAKYANGRAPGHVRSTLIHWFSRALRFLRFRLSLHCRAARHDLEAVERRSPWCGAIGTSPRRAVICRVSRTGRRQSWIADNARSSLRAIVSIRGRNSLRLLTYCIVDPFNS